MCAHKKKTGNASVFVKPTDFKCGWQTDRQTERQKYAWPTCQRFWGTAPCSRFPPWHQSCTDSTWTPQMPARDLFQTMLVSGLLRSVSHQHVFTQHTTRKRLNTHACTLSQRWTYAHRAGQTYAQQANRRTPGGRHLNCRDSRCKYTRRQTDMCTQQANRCTHTSRHVHYREWQTDIYTGQENNTQTGKNTHTLADRHAPYRDRCVNTYWQTGAQIHRGRQTHTQADGHIYG